MADERRPAANGPTLDDDEQAARLDGLGPGQRRVLERLLGDPRDGAVISAKELADELAVSPATITRAAQALGFAGFPDLRSHLRDRYFRLSRARLAANVAAGAETPAAAALRVMHKDAEDVRATAEALDPADLQAAAELLLAARRVYVFGSRGSHALALLLAMRLRTDLDDPRLLSQTAGDLPDQLGDLAAADVLVVISYSLIDRVAVRTLEAALAVGAGTLVITNHHPNPLSRLAGQTLIARAELLPPLPSYTAGVALVNGLTMTVALQSGEAARARRQRIDRLLEAFETFAGW